MSSSSWPPDLANGLDNYVVEELLIQRTLVVAHDRESAQERAHHGNPEQVWIERDPLVVRIFPALDPESDEESIWDLAPAGETKGMFSLSQPRSNTLMATIGRYQRYLSTVQARREQLVVELIAGEIRRQLPGSRIAVFCVREGPEGQLSWDQSPLILSQEYCNALGGLTVVSQDGWFVAASLDGATFEPDQDTQQVFSTYLSEMLDGPETDEDLLVIDLEEEILIPGPTRSPL